MSINDLPNGGKNGKIILVGGIKKYFTNEQIKKNARRTMDRDESALEENRRRANISVLGKVGGGVKGTAATRFGLGKSPLTTGFAKDDQTASAGFAQNNNDTKLTGNSARYRSLKGQKPIGL